MSTSMSAKSKTTSTPKVTTTQGTKTAAGTVNYNPNTGAKLKAGETVTVKSGGNTYGSNQSTTTLSSNKASDILNTSNGITNMSGGGITTDPETGVSNYSNGSVYDPKVADTTDEDDDISSIYKELLKRTDSDAASSIQSINNKYEGLKQTQTKINESNSAATQGALFRSGAAQGDAYAGNTMGYQTQQNADAIVALENEQLDAINSAKAAQNAGRFKIAEMKLADAKDAKKRKQDLIDAENERLASEIVRAQETEAQIQKENAVVELYNTGITDPTEIFRQLKQLGFSPTLKEVNDTVALVSGIGGTGIVAEFNFDRADRKARGMPTISFEEFQNLDSNRKRSIAAASNIAGSDLNTKETAIFNKIVDKYNASPAIKALDKANMLKSIADEVLVDPNNATSQLALIYSYIKGLDTDSAVKEGEIDLVRSIQSYLGNFQNSFERITNGKPVNADTATKIANGSIKLIESIENTAKRKEADFKAQAKVNGKNVLSAWDEYRDSAQQFKDELDADEKNDPLGVTGETNTTNVNNPLGI